VYGGILIYHTIADYPALLPAGIGTPPAQFAAHVEMLRRRLRIVPLAEMVAHFRAHRRLPRGAAAITFDDGYADNEAAADCLRAADAPATFFVATDRIDGRWRSPLGEIPAIRRGQIERLAADPLFAVGSHGAGHRKLAALGPEDIREDLVRSIAALEPLAGGPVRWVAYPFGSFSRTVTQVAAELGFKAGFAVHNRQVDPMAIPRIPVHTGDRPRRLAFKLSRWYAPAWRLLRRPQMTGG
jgi:peptidoglycan/xylan/chitin deacetylase (PgdA/CDA1 family)